MKQVQLDRPGAKAILVYADHDSAAKAWNDPRAVFNNRFVKIWWKKSDPTETPVTTKQAVEEVDIEAAKEQALKAQRDHEEKQRRKMELEKQKQELERKAAELIEKQRLEKEKLMEKIRRAKEKAKETQNGTPNSGTQSPVTTKAESPEATKVEVNGKSKADGEHSAEPEASQNPRKAQLQKMLSDLKNQVPPYQNLSHQQANKLNIPPSEYTMPPLSDTRTKSTYSRGGYRGRGNYASRALPRGRGRGGFSRSLDLRPKSIQISEIHGTDNETSVREWLIMNSADATTETGANDSLIITFKERFEAEEVIYSLFAMGGKRLIFFFL